MQLVVVIFRRMETWMVLMMLSIFVLVHFRVKKLMGTVVQLVSVILIMMGLRIILINVQ